MAMACGRSSTLAPSKEGSGAWLCTQAPWQLWTVLRCCAHLHGLEQPVAGHMQVKLHAWFAGLDWANLARTKAAFIPELDSPTDTAYFAPKPARIPVPLCCSKNGY